MNSKFIYPAVVTYIVDADTIDVKFDLGFNLKLDEQRIRLYGINAYEVKMYKGVTIEEKARGLEAKQKVKDLVPLGTEIMIETYLTAEGKYGRILGTVWIPNDTMLFEDYTPESTLVNQPISMVIDGKTYYNLNYWLVTQEYAIEKVY